MAKKNDDLNQLVGMMLKLAGIVIFSVFLINTYVTFKKYSKKYSFDDADIRVHDAANPLRYIPVAIAWGVLLLLSAFGILYGVDKNSILIASGSTIAFLVAIGGMFVLSSRIATTQVGMLTYKSKGIFVIPSDYRNNTLQDNILKLQAAKDLCSMEELPIKAVARVTRQGGTKVFIHGSFGTRCLSWRDKQKRDECIAALEMACGRRLSSMDMGQ